MVPILDWLVAHLSWIPFFAGPASVTGRTMLTAGLVLALMILPIVSAVFCVGLMTNLALETWLRFLVWLVVGLGIYLFYGRTHSKLETKAAASEDATPVG